MLSVVVIKRFVRVQMWELVWFNKKAAIAGIDTCQNCALALSKILDIVLIVIGRGAAANESAVTTAKLSIYHAKRGRMRKWEN